MKRNGWMLPLVLTLVLLIMPCAAFAAGSGKGMGGILMDEFSYESAALAIAEESEGEWEFYGGEEYTMYVEIENTSGTKTVSEYVMGVEALDAYGFPLEESSMTVVGEIPPGRRTWSGGMEMCYGADVFIVYAWIEKVEYTDGTQEYLSHPVKGFWYVE